jgi:hypothetical protein
VWQAGPIYEDELYEGLVAQLVKGSRLHCFVDTCRGIFALGLPSCVYTRADGWSNWEASTPVCPFPLHLSHIPVLRWQHPLHQWRCTLTRALPLGWAHRP